jgi:sec-independent protein translocase protein TatA
MEPSRRRRLMGLGWWHIVIVVAIFVLLFGAGKISALMTDVAKGVRNFSKAMADQDDTSAENVGKIEAKSRRRTPRPAKGA